MASPRTQPPASFFFVNGNSMLDRRQALVHHRREARRQKNHNLAELHQAHTRHADMVFCPSRQISEGISNDSARIPVLEHESSETITLLGGINENDLDDELSIEQHVWMNNTSREISLNHAYRGSPKGILGAGRVDPFASYPFEIKRASREIFDHFAKVMPSLEFGVDGMSPFNPQHHCCLAEGMNYSPTLHAFIAASGIHFASLDKHVEQTVEYHMAESLRLLRNDVEKQHRDQQSKANMIGAIIALAAAEGLRGNRASCRIHLNALKTLITLAGGLQTLEKYPRIQILACFVASIWETSYLPKANSDDPPAIKEIQDHLIQFQGFFLRMRLIASKPCNIADEAESIVDRPVQNFLLGPAGPWRALLAPSDADPSCTMAGVSVHDIHRSACLLHLCAALLDCQHSIAKAEDYLYCMFSAFQSHHLDIRPNLRLFVFILIKTYKTPSTIEIEDAARSWLVVRLMQVIKTLSWETRAAVNKTLLCFLLSEPLYSFSEDAVIGDIYNHPSIIPGLDLNEASALKGDSDISRARGIGVI